MNSSLACLASCMFSGDSAPGMYWLMYAVARYKRGMVLSGSSCTAFLK